MWLIAGRGGPMLGWEDPASRWQLMHGHRDSLIAAVALHCADRADAEDCVHDAFLQVVQRPDVDPDRLGGLLRTVALRRAIDTRRHRIRHGDALGRLGPAWTAAPDELALDRCEAVHLAGVVRGLPSGQRRAVAARAAGIEPRETAARHGVPAKSVHLALARARATLRAAVGPALGWLLWLRRQFVSPRAHLAPVALVAVAGFVLLFRLDQPNVRMSHAAAARAPVLRTGSASAAPPAPPAASVHAAAPHDRVATAAPSRSSREAPEFHAVLGAPGVAGVGVTLSKRRPDQSFLQSVDACLAPGGLSVDLHHAGCTAAY